MTLVKKQSGFTLIELVVVIVILGILAATAAPKFIDLQDDARTATLDAVKASMESASTLIHSKSLIAGNNESGTGTVMVNDKTVDIANGYPTSAGSPTDGDYSTAAEMWAGSLIELDASEFTISSTLVAGSIYIHPANMTPPDSPTLNDACIVHYTQTGDANTPPDIQSNPCT